MSRGSAAGKVVGWLGIAMLTSLSGGVMAAPLSGSEEMLLQQLADPAFYTHPHRREAIGDALAMVETMLAATGSYRMPHEAGPLLHGASGQALRLLAAGGGRAGEIARIMQSEAEKGLYGDPSHPLRGQIGADERATTEFRIAAGATQRLLLDSGGSGRLFLGATCSMELRELPHNANGQLDLGADPGTSLAVGSGDPAHYPLTAPLTSFGVAPGEDCGDQTHTLLVAWSPAPPRLTATHDGKLLVRQPGRYQVDLVDGAAALRFDLPAGAVFELSARDASITAEGPALQGRQWVRGGASEARIEAPAKQLDLLVVRADLPRLLPGEVLQANAQRSAQLFEVSTPPGARGYLRVETLPGTLDGDPMLHAFDRSGETIAQDDDSGEGLNAALEVPVIAGTVQTFAVADLREEGVPSVRVSLIEQPSQIEEP
ncbi:MAG: hypothetical protein KDI48_16165 [Xanthomonadales bacterium]|nr:hypothetical protein [Xanthomonadales bacterium]